MALPLPPVLSPLNDLIDCLRYSLSPTIRAVFRKPALLLSPSALRREFFSHTWALASDGMDAGRKEAKQKLLEGKVEGKVLDVGAGRGVTLRYLDKHKVELYIALEPNVNMHRAIMEEARALDWRPSQILLLPYTLEELPSLFSSPSVPISPNSLNHVLAILTLCSCHQSSISNIHNVLKPGGTFLFHEHILHPSSRWIRTWQRFWSPIVVWFFDGCRLDKNTMEGIGRAGEWKEVECETVGRLDGLYPAVSGFATK
ncbi:S-adenosyl-L-methionine-dependent methyltransferase [Atractiella rhizophila]|nr:S-adenosyl-L-methionine-dependent methyltransferase [Atractiella rhizophila]